MSYYNKKCFMFFCQFPSSCVIQIYREMKYSLSQITGNNVNHSGLYTKPSFRASFSFMCAIGSFLPFEIPLQLYFFWTHDLIMTLETAINTLPIISFNRIKKTSRHTVLHGKEKGPKK